MKTTIELSEPLLEDARALARREHTTLRALLEEALRQLIESRNRPQTFKLEDRSFPPPGTGSGAEPMSWDETRRLIYEGRGG